MPSASEFSVTSYKQASSLPESVVRALEENRIDANVILPFLKKADNERSSSSDQLWLVCQISYTNVVELVLSCTSSEMGQYPIFIVPTQPLSRWSRDSLRARLRLLAETLHNLVDPKRVYSVFAPDLTSELFSQSWSELTEINVIREPYYAARLLSCTAVANIQLSSSFSGVPRPAYDADTDALANLCLEFSNESKPFTLDRREAVKEARFLIANKLVWVYCTPRGSGPLEITCLAAFTRNTASTATITKVYTSPSWRSRGCAKRLVQAVCNHLLVETDRREVVLYVAHSNKGAAKVYESVGFVGPEAAAVQCGHTLRWTEWGFDREKVELGHW